MSSLCFRKNDFSCSFDFLPVSSVQIFFLNSLSSNLKTILLWVLKVMAAPVSPDDQMRVQKTFDEAAGPVRISLLLKVYI